MLAILGTVLLVTVPKGSHSGPTGGCLEKIASDALKAGSLRNLDPDLRSSDTWAKVPHRGRAT